jgi:large subunit ribosomal protein L22
MEIRSTAKFVRISAEKAVEVARLLAGKPVEEAVAMLKLNPRKSARIMLKVLLSAVANAENNLNIKRASLSVKTATVTPGPMFKRFRPKARGSAGRIRKRTSHFFVVISDEKL